MSDRQGVEIDDCLQCLLFASIARPPGLMLRDDILPALSLEGPVEHQGAEVAGGLGRPNRQHLKLRSPAYCGALGAFEAH